MKIVYIFYVIVYGFRGLLDRRKSRERLRGRRGSRSERKVSEGGVGRRRGS